MVCEACNNVLFESHSYRTRDNGMCQWGETESIANGTLSPCTVLTQGEIPRRAQCFEKSNERNTPDVLRRFLEQKIKIQLYKT